MAWKVQRECELMEFKTEQEQRLHDLALCMVIPWKDGFPSYWLDDKNEPQRLDEIREATKDERLPWAR